MCRRWIGLGHWVRSLWVLSVLAASVPVLFATEAPKADGLMDLGNKAAQSRQRGHSLNIWDLQSFDSKIFIGMGSTVRNTGPVPIWAYDHAMQKWGDGPEAVIDQEAIELFRVLDGVLYIPAADPKGEIGDRSKFYRRDPDGSWTHFVSSRTFLTAHIRDLVIHEDWVIGVGNSRRPHNLTRARTGSVALPLLAVQNTRGGVQELPLYRSAITLEPWAESGALVDEVTSQRNRAANWFFSVFYLHDGLYASTRWLSWGSEEPGRAVGRAHRPELTVFPPLVRWNSAIEQWVAPASGELHRLVPLSPERDTGLTLWPFKPVLFGELWFAPLRGYSLHRANYGDYYNQSADFVVKPADGPGRRVTLPDSDALGEAVLIHDDKLFVLANAPQPNGGYRIAIYSLEAKAARAAHLSEETGMALDVWREVLHFRHANLARSFARIEDTWYFGLGFATGDPPGAAGTLLRYNKSQRDQ